MSVNLIWFRNDLRVDDNPALFNAGKNGHPTLAIYFYCPQQLLQHAVGRNHQALIAQALINLKQQLSALNIPLLIIQSTTFSQIPDDLQLICEQLHIDNCYFNIEYPVNERQRDLAVVELLKDRVTFHRYNDQTLVPPWEITNAEGNGYKVFSAFAKIVRRKLLEKPLDVFPVAKKIKENHSIEFYANQLSVLKVIPHLPLDTAITVKLPNIDEIHLSKMLHQFIAEKIQSYQTVRDIPSLDGTSNLSAAFAVGAISVKRCFALANDFAEETAYCWTNELIWRDFYRSVVWHYPKVVKGHGFNDVDRQLRWSPSLQHLTQWKTATTGVPIVDAAMRQLIQTGWMHNRLRMIVASYLCKNLWINWREGERFFAQHLFDYDFASNNGGWQWCASTGTDAAPYFRVFNPASQQKRFDPQAEFIKQWLPELAQYSAKQIHQFETKPLAGYFPSQVDLKDSRKQAIEQFKNAKMMHSMLLENS